MRLGAEVSHFVHGADGCDDLHPLHHLVWSRIAFTIGFVNPTNTGTDAATELALQKASFDRCGYAAGRDHA